MKVNNYPVILWFRQDLRISDNPALKAALSHNKPLVPVYIQDVRDSKWSNGRASEWWLLHSLRKLDAQLRAAGSRLIIRRGKPDAVLEQLTDELAARHLFYNRRYEPQGIKEQESVERALKLKGVVIESFNASLLFEPELIKTRKGEPFKVFTPFWEACLESPAPTSLLPTPKQIMRPKRWPVGEKIDQLQLEWDESDTMNLATHWSPGADMAMKMLNSFAARRVCNYETDRDRPDLAGTSRLSPYLHFGEISPRQIWNRIQKSISGKTSGKDMPGALAFLRQLGWREFAYHLLYHFPFTTDKPLRSKYVEFPWKHSNKSLAAWRDAQTGYPIVDAGMRELVQSGWMHNRVRMIAASFLIKHLLIPWQHGARWFWEKLVDADLANNTLGWQWVAGCGADAAPFFRIFNPMLQGTKFDPEGSYVRKWIPELNGLPDRWIHCPWQAPAKNLREAGVRLGRTYPSPIVNHLVARQKALRAYNEIRAKK